MPVVEDSTPGTHEEGDEKTVRNWLMSGSQNYEPGTDNQDQPSSPPVRSTGKDNKTYNNTHAGV